MEHLGYVLWGTLAVAWFRWLALQPGHASKGASAPPAVTVTALPPVAEPEPAVAAVVDAEPSLAEPAVAPLDTLPGTLAALPPLAADVLPSHAQRRWWLGFVK